MEPAKITPFLTVDDIFGSQYIWFMEINGLKCKDSIPGNEAGAYFDKQNIVNTGKKLTFELTQPSNKSMSFSFIENNIDLNTLTPALLAKHNLRPYLVGTKTYPIAIIADTCLEQARLQVKNELVDVCFDKDELDNVFVEALTVSDFLLMPNAQNFWQIAIEMKQPQRIHDFQ
jgi:hypothetical protein